MQRIAVAQLTQDEVDALLDLERNLEGAKVFLEDAMAIAQERYQKTVAETSQLWDTLLRKNGLPYGNYSLDRETGAIYQMTNGDPDATSTNCH